MPHKPEPKILMDLDGVMCDFTEAFTRTARHIRSDQQIISTVSQPSWNLTGCMDKALVNATWDKIRTSTEWWRREPWPLYTPKELAQLRHLQAAHEVVFCTSRNTHNPSDPPISEQSISWLESHGIHRPSLVVSKNKGDVARALGATHSIEDRPENACMIHWVTDGSCASYILDRPYNRAYPLPAGVVRVSSLGEFFDAIEGPSSQTKLDKHPNSAHLFSVGGKSA
jgi:uncharacterized HAD superfamily protein